MAVARREQAGFNGQGGLPERPRGTTPARAHLAAVPAPAPPPSPGPPPVRRRLALGEQRHHGSLRVYLLLLAAGTLIALGFAARFVSTTAGACTGADAAGDCLLHKLIAPGLTRFALVLAAAHLLALLVADVLPGVRRKRRQGYRLRREPRAPVPFAAAPGMPLEPLAAATWAPVQQPRPLFAGTPALRPRPARPLVARAVCPACVTIVAVRGGSCQDCGGAVVARRG